MASLALDVGDVTPGTPGSAPSAISTGSNGMSQEALRHVLDNVLCLPRDSGIRLSLQAAGCVKIQQVVSMSPANIKALSYKTRAVNTSINMGLLICEEETLQALQGFARYKRDHLGRRLTPDDWLEVTEDEFDEYQGSADFLLPSTPPTPVAFGGHSTAPSNTPGHVTVAPPVVSAAAAFRRGIKRDQSLFPVLKQERDWDDWQRRTRIQAVAQGVEDVLNMYYKPDPADAALFLEQSKYMMAVFSSTLQTDFGKSLLRKYEGTYDAQSLFGELERHTLSSTAAIVLSEEVMQ